MLRSKHLVGLILAATLMATFIPFSAIVYAQTKEEAKGFIKLAEQAKDKADELMEIMKNEGLEIPDATMKRYEEGVGNLTVAEAELEKPERDLNLAVELAKKAMEAFKEVYEELYTLLEGAGVTTASDENEKAEGLLVAMERALARIERLRGIAIQPYSLEAGGGGTAEWTTAEKKSGEYSVMLSIPNAADPDQYAEVSIPVDFTLGDLDPDTTSFWCKVTAGAYTPYFIFELDNGEIFNTDGFDSAGYSNWAKYVASHTPQWQDDDGEWHDTLDDLISAHGYDPETLKVVRVLVELSGFPIGGLHTAYVDDVTVNEPLAVMLAILDSAEQYLNIETAKEWLSEGKVSQTAWNLAQANQLISLAHSSLKEKAGELNVKRIESYLKLIESLCKKVEKAVNRLPETAADDCMTKIDTANTLIEGAETAFTAENYSDAIAKLASARNILKEIERDLLELRRG